MSARANNISSAKKRGSSAAAPTQHHASAQRKRKAAYMTSADRLAAKKVKSKSNFSNVSSARFFEPADENENDDADAPLTDKQAAALADSDDERASDSNDSVESELDPHANETADEKRIRLTKQYIASIEKRAIDSDDDDESDTAALTAAATAHSAVGKVKPPGLTKDGIEDVVSHRLQREHMQQQYRLHTPVAQKLLQGRVFSPDAIVQHTRAHSQCITCLCGSGGRRAEQLWTGSKDGTVIEWTRNSTATPATQTITASTATAASAQQQQQQQPLYRKSFTYVSNRNKPSIPHGHFGAVLAIAVSNDGQFLATAGEDKRIQVWNARTRAHIRQFTEHRDAVTCLAFQYAPAQLQSGALVQGTHTLYSASRDRTVKMYSLNAQQATYVDTLFGHTDDVTSLHSFANNDRLLTCSVDKSLRLWKIIDEVQLLFAGGHDSSKAASAASAAAASSSMGAIDVCTIVDERHFVSGGNDGALCLWNDAKKRPIATLRSVHHGKWITALVAHRFSDLCFSASHDGFVNAYRLDLQKGGIFKIAHFPMQGFVNAMILDADCKTLICTTSKEHRFGRWQTEKAKNALAVIDLTKGQLAAAPSAAPASAPMQTAQASNVAH